MLKLNEPLRTTQRSGYFCILSFLNSSDLCFKNKTSFFLQFFDILPFGSGFLDPHIFTDPDPDPGSQNLADPTDPDSKH